MGESYQLVQDFNMKIYNQTDLTHAQKLAIDYLLRICKEITKGKDHIHLDYILEKLFKFFDWAADKGDGLGIDGLEPKQLVMPILMHEKYDYWCQRLLKAIKDMV